MFSLSKKTSSSVGMYFKSWSNISLLMDLVRSQDRRASLMSRFDIFSFVKRMLQFWALLEEIRQSSGKLFWLLL